MTTATRATLLTLPWNSTSWCRSFVHNATTMIQDIDRLSIIRIQANPPSARKILIQFKLVPSFPRYHILSLTDISRIKRSAEIFSHFPTLVQIACLRVLFIQAPSVFGLVVYESSALQRIIALFSSSFWNLLIIVTLVRRVFPSNARIQRAVMVGLMESIVWGRICPDAPSSLVFVLLSSACHLVVVVQSMMLRAGCVSSLDHGCRQPRSSIL